MEESGLAASCPSPGRDQPWAQGGEMRGAEVPDVATSSPDPAPGRGTERSGTGSSHLFTGSNAGEGREAAGSGM